MSALDNVHYGFGHHYKLLSPLNSVLMKDIGGDFGALDYLVQI